MKKLIYFLIVCSFFTNCTHQISRIKYTVEPKRVDQSNCNIPVKKFAIVPDSIATRIGKIKLSDSGFSRHCSEEDATAIIEKEGCALNADFINISNESKPDSISNCYRCNAEFYKYKK